MRVGLVVERFDPCRGGKEQWSAQFAAKLIERGHEMHVVASRFGAGVESTPVVCHAIEDTRSPVAFAEAAEKLLRGLPLDVIHDTGAGWYCDVFQPHGGSRRATTEHNLLMLPEWARPMKRLLNGYLPRYRRFDRLMQRQYANDGRIFLALSRQTQADIHELHGIPREQIRLGYNGVDPARFSPEHRTRHRERIRRQLGVDDETLVLLIVAHNFPLKGVPVLIRAMGHLASRRRPVHLAVVGGKHLRRYRRAAARLGAASAVTFTGTVSDPVPFYAGADAYVHPTFHDPCSLVVLEALASGLPVITSRLNGVAELLSEGVEGYVLPNPADLDGLLARLELLFDHDRRRRMGLAARRLALEHSLERNVNEVLAVYEEVVRNRQAGERETMPRATRPLVVPNTCPSNPNARH